MQSLLPEQLVKRSADKVVNTTNISLTSYNNNLSNAPSNVTKLKSGNNGNMSSYKSRKQQKDTEEFDIDAIARELNIQ